MTKPKIYYAHPMSWYDTPEEKADLDALASEGTVINPNTPYFQTSVMIAQQNNEPVMQVFADFIQSDNCDVVCFRRFNDGKIGAGVAREIFEAIIWGKEVWEIEGGNIVHRTFNREGKYVVDDYLIPIIVDKALLMDTEYDYSDTQGPDIVLADILTVAETRRRIKEKQL